MADLRESRMSISNSPGAENALPNRAAKIVADDEVDDDHREQDQRRHAVELESVAGQSTGRIADDIATDEKDRQEVEYSREYLAPGRYRFDSVYHSAPHSRVTGSASVTRLVTKILTPSHQIRR